MNNTAEPQIQNAQLCLVDCVVTLCLGCLKKRKLPLNELRNRRVCAIVYCWKSKLLPPNAVGRRAISKRLSQPGEYLKKMCVGRNTRENGEFGTLHTPSKCFIQSTSTSPPGRPLSFQTDQPPTISLTVRPRNV